MHTVGQSRNLDQTVVCPHGLRVAQQGHGESVTFMNHGCSCAVTELLIPLLRIMTTELEIRRREKEGICILDLDGHLTIGPSEQQLRSNVAKLAGGGATKIILDFADLDQMDADGLGALVYCHPHLLLLGGGSKLLSLRQNHIELLILAKLVSVFQIFTGEQDAIDSFFPDRQSRRYDILEFVEEQEKRA